MKSIAILGSTGSIGTQALEVIRHLGNGYRVTGLSAYGNVSRLKAQLLEFKPHIASIDAESDAEVLRKFCKSRKLNTKIVSGARGLIEVAGHISSNLVLASVVGSAGINAVLEAIRHRKDIALANKEALVVAGPIIKAEAAKYSVKILPVDSEHSAIFQCIKGEKSGSIKSIMLTASGGPFYRSKKTSNITVAQALAHPTWKMGKKITIDSATLMNKGLEAIEASYLFDVPLDKIHIVIHPQSIVHSLVQFADGSVLAQLSNPDMRLPIQYALTYPERVRSQVKELSLTEIKTLEFGKPDFKRFPCLNLALKAGKTGGTMPAVMNAANEAAVKGFLEKKISFADIPKIINKVMKSRKTVLNPALWQIIAEDSAARKTAREIVEKYNP